VLNCTADVIFVIDSSGSIGEQRWHVIKQFVIDVILGLNIKASGSRIGVVVFSTNVNIVFNIDEFDNVNSMTRAVWEMPFMADASNTADGLLTMHEMFSKTRRPVIQQIAILLTDDASNVDSARTVPEATAAKEDGIYIVVLGMDGYTNDTEAMSIASEPDGVIAFNPSNNNNVNNMTKLIVALTCGESQLRQCDECEWSECSETCGNIGTITGVRSCWEIDPFTLLEKNGSRIENITCEPDKCFIPCAISIPIETTTNEPTTTSETTTTTQATTTSEETTTGPETTTIETTTTEPTTASAEYNTTTKEPTTTTSEATTTTQATTTSEETTTGPETTTIETTTTEPTTTSAEYNTTTKEPTTTTSEATTTTQATTTSEETTTGPETTTIETTTTEPTTTSAEYNTTTKEPTTTTSEATTTTQATTTSEETTTGPETTTIETTITEPTTTSAEYNTTTKEPTTTTSEATTTTQEETTTGPETTTIETTPEQTTTTTEPTTTSSEDNTTIREPTTTIYEATTTTQATTTSEETTTGPETTTIETTPEQTTTTEPTTTSAEDNTTTKEPITTSETTTTTQEDTTTGSDTTTTETTTEQTTTTTTITSTTEPSWQVDCFRCNQAMGQLWRPDPFNCHMFYICELLPGGDYRAHHVTCGHLFWDQSLRACRRLKTGDCVVADVIVYTTTPRPIDATKAPCPLSPYPGDARKFWIEGDATSVQTCVDGMEFTNEGELCDCIFVNALARPNCSSDLLLYLPFDDHFNDITCNKAIATRYGKGVSIVNDPQRGRVAFFNGHGYLEVSFLRSWLSASNVDKFTVTLWLKLTDNTASRGAIINNGDCSSSPSIQMAVNNGTVFAGIKTDGTGEVVTTGQTVNPNQWYKAKWMYDGALLKFYLDGDLVKTTPAQGFMSNTDVPLYIGSTCGLDNFVGYLDD
ncbi:hypothetical protein LSAT2_007250, partial [Lamellibrachia satsuma]